MTDLSYIFFGTYSSLKNVSPSQDFCFNSFDELRSSFFDLWDSDVLISMSEFMFSFSFKGSSEHFDIDCFVNHKNSTIKSFVYLYGDNASDNLDDNLLYSVSFDNLNDFFDWFEYMDKVNQFCFVSELKNDL